MISLSYSKIVINGGIPGYRRVLPRDRRCFTIQADMTAATFHLALELMPGFKTHIEKRRVAIDISHYPAAAQGYRFPQGNSQIETETRGGIPIKICLFFAEIENSARGFSPSHFCDRRIHEIAHELKSKAPRLVTYDSTLAKTVGDVAARPLLMAGGQVVAFPGAVGQAAPL